MKKIVTLLILCLATVGYSQDKKPTFKADGDLVKATYYYADGAISTQGYFKDKKLTGEWIRFDKEGNKIQIAYYDNGKKVGKWSVFTKESVKEINYNNNVIVNVSLNEQDVNLASNK